MINFLADSGVIVAVIGVMGTFVKSILDNRHLAEIQQRDIENATEERKLMLKSLLVVLRKLNDDHVNGDVEQAIKSVGDFLLEASHKSSSNIKKR